MKHMQTIGAGLGVFLAAALIAGCGGGSQSANSLATTATIPGQSAPQSAQTAALTITVNIPQTAQTAAVRRNPAYISPATTSIYAYAEPSNTSGSNSCTGTTCTLTLQAPLTTTSIEVQLYGNAGLLSQATRNVTITAGAANAFSFIFNGVVNYFQTTASIAQAVIGVNQPFTVTLTPFDAAGDEIMTSGALVDSSGNVIVGATGAPQSITLSASGTDASYLTVGTPTFSGTTYLLTATATYNDGGAGTYGGVTITPASSATSAVSFDSVTIPVNPKYLAIVANAATASPVAYDVMLNSPMPYTNTQIEVPTLPTPVPIPVYLSVVSNFATAGDRLTLNNDSCTSLSYYDPGLNAAFPSPGPTMPSTLAYPFTVNIAAPSPDGNGTNINCSFTVSDAAKSLSATGSFFLDSTSLTISAKKRK